VDTGLAASAALADVTGNGMNEVVMRVVIQNNVPATSGIRIYVGRDFPLLDCVHGELLSF
jgi:hypothetical protein